MATMRTASQFFSVVCIHWSETVTVCDSSNFSDVISLRRFSESPKKQKTNKQRKQKQACRRTDILAGIYIAVCQRTHTELWNRRKDKHKQTHSNNQARPRHTNSLSLSLTHTHTLCKEIKSKHTPALTNPSVIPPDKNEKEKDKKNFFKN